jgi:ADP-ribose pyrophosphatase YjhB (NUDIX family)
MDIGAMKFCTHCGQRLVHRMIDGDSRERYVCVTCNFVHYENPKIMVGCFIHWRDKVVLCRRAIEPAKGKWEQPTGFLEVGETLEEGASREVLEETGLHVPSSSMALYLVASIPHMSQVFIIFRAELQAEPQFAVGPDVSEARMFSEAEFPTLDIAFREMIPEQHPGNFFRHLRERVFPVITTTVRPPAQLIQPTSSNATPLR